MCPDITSRQHRIVHDFKSAARREGELALIDGWHLLTDAVEASLDIAVVAVAASPRADHESALLERLGEQCEVVTVSTAVMDAMSPTRTPSGVVALVRPRQVAFGELLTPSPALVVVASDVQDPGNAGAIVRSAEAGGATGVLFSGRSADPWGWKALRAGMGSTFRCGVARIGDTTAAMHELRRAGLALLAAVPHGAPPMHDVDLRRGIALVLGGEGAGLDATVTTLSDERVSIPMSGRVESLNVAVAAALLIYEAQRQRAWHQVRGT